MKTSPFYSLLLCLLASLGLCFTAQAKPKCAVAFDPSTHNVLRTSAGYKCISLKGSIVPATTPIYSGSKFVVTLTCEKSQLQTLLKKAKGLKKSKQQKKLNRLKNIERSINCKDKNEPGKGVPTLTPVPTSTASASSHFACTSAGEWKICLSSDEYRTCTTDRVAVAALGATRSDAKLNANRLCERRLAILVDHKRVNQPVSTIDETSIQASCSSTDSDCIEQSGPLDSDSSADPTSSDPNSATNVNKKYCQSVGAYEICYNQSDQGSSPRYCSTQSVVASGFGDDITAAQAQALERCSEQLTNNVILGNFNQNARITTHCAVSTCPRS